MLKAEQGLLLQNTNHQLLAIRQSELDYFINVFDTYSFQAILVAGNIANGFEQVLSQDAHIPRWLKSGYWITSAIAMCFSIHCIATSAFVMIYGPGLALRGPLGSMNRAVKGMQAEHTQIFMSYCGCIISFGISSFLCFSFIYHRSKLFILCLEHNVRKRGLCLHGLHFCCILSMVSLLPTSL